MRKLEAWHTGYTGPFHLTPHRPNGWMGNSTWINLVQLNQQEPSMWLPLASTVSNWLKGNRQWSLHLGAALHSHWDQLNTIQFLIVSLSEIHHSGVEFCPILNASCNSMLKRVKWVFCQVFNENLVELSDYINWVKVEFGRILNWTFPARFGTLLKGIRSPWQCPMRPSTQCHSTPPVTTAGLWRYLVHSTTCSPRGLACGNPIYKQHGWWKSSGYLQRRRQLSVLSGFCLHCVCGKLRNSGSSWNQNRADIASKSNTQCTGSSGQRKWMKTEEEDRYHVDACALSHSFHAFPVISFS